MAARVKALLGGRAKDAAFLRAPSGGQKTNHGKKSLITKVTFLHFFQLKRPEKSYTTALAMTGTIVQMQWRLHTLLPFSGPF